METKNQRCRECGRELSKVAPRWVTVITAETPLPPRKHHKPLLGAYCSPDCVLDAIQRGVPKKP